MNIMDRCIDDLYMHIYSKKKVSNNHSLSTCALMAVINPLPEKNIILFPPNSIPKRKREKEKNKES